MNVPPPKPEDGIPSRRPFSGGRADIVTKRQDAPGRKAVCKTSVVALFAVAALKVEASAHTLTAESVPF